MSIETKTTFERVTRLQALNSNGARHFHDQLTKRYGTTRKSEIVAKIGNNGKPYEQLLNDDIFGTGSETALVAYIQGLSNLVRYWRLNEASGNATNSAPATVGAGDGVPTSLTQGVTGQVGLAASFNGTTSLITVPDANDIDLTTNFSVWAIINPTTFGENTVGRILDKQAGASTSYFFAINGTGSLFLLARDASNTINSNGSVVTTGAWQMLGASYDGANVSYYKNGTAVGTPASVTQATANTNDLIIGNRLAADRTFSGSMQHIGLRNAVTSGAEFLAMAQAAGLA